MSELEFTGERLVPGIFGKIAAEHLHRYALCLDFIQSKKVLDIASGEGYGSNLLAKYAKEVIGVDISDEAVLHAQKVYTRQNLRFQVGSVLDIPCDTESFDVVVSFETIEHISDHQKMIAEIKRVLKPDGVLVVSTPEKSVYSDQANYSNPFHEKELYEKDFVQILNNEFLFLHLGYQKYLSGSFIQSRDESGEKLKFFSGDFFHIQENLALNQEYLVAVCSNSPKQLTLSSSFYDSCEVDNNEKDQMVKNRLSKIKLGFRYRMIDFIFKPWDLIKPFLK